MLERDILKPQAFEGGQCNRMLGCRLHRQLEDGLKILERRLRFTIRIDHVAQFLQGAKDEERIDEERKELSDRDALREDQVEHQKHDRRPQEIHAGALYETQTAQIAHLLQFQLENLVGGTIQPLNLLLGEPQTLYKLDVSQRLRRGACQRGGLPHDAPLDELDLSAQQGTQAAEQGDR